MADPHELGPSTFTGEIPDCSNCLLARDVAAYVAYRTSEEGMNDSKEELPGGRSLTDGQIRKLFDLLTLSPDLRAVAVEMRRLRICPMVMTESENPEHVSALVPVGVCVSFDRKHRPGVQLDR